MFIVPDDHDDDYEELILVLNRVSLVTLISKLSEGLSANCHWEDWSPGIARWLPSLHGHWRCSFSGWRIVMLGHPGWAIKCLDLWGFNIVNAEWPQFDEIVAEERLLMIDFNPYQFCNLTGGGDGPLSTYCDPEKTIQFAPLDSVNHGYLHEVLPDQIPCRIWMSKERIDVTAVRIAEDMVVEFHVGKHVS